MTQARLKKYSDIVRLLARHGGADLVRHAKFEPGVTLAEGPSVDPPSNDPDGLARDLEALGPTFIKLGQLLSTRGDLLPDSYLDALARLQDRVEPFSIAEVRKIVSAEFGKPVAKLFRQFEPEPLAAASLAQVHRARLLDGTRVAVKVQRPDIRERIEDDLEVMRAMADLADKHTEIGKKYEFRRMVDEFAKTLVDELDFEQEAHHMDVIGAHLSTFESILVPKPIDTHTSPRVLTMEYVRGHKVTGAERKKHVNGPLLAEQLFSAYLQQILIDGLFHADPHPGNIIITPEGRLALIDLGMVGRISPAMQEDLLKLMLAVSEGESRDAADIAIRTSEARESFDEPAFRRQMNDVILRYRDAELKHIPVGKVILEITRIAVENGLRIVPELTLVAKTLLNLDEAARRLDPEFDPNHSIQRNAARLIQQRLLHAASPANVFTSVLETKDFVQALPERANRILDALARNELRFKVEMIDEGAVIDGLQKVANRITLGLVIASLILGAALLMQIDTPFKILGYPGLAILCFLLAAAAGLWLSFRIIESDRTPKPRVRS